MIEGLSNPIPFPFQSFLFERVFLTPNKRSYITLGNGHCNEYEGPTRLRRDSMSDLVGDEKQFE